MRPYIGLRIYNRGDMMNEPHWGTVTKIIKSERFSDQVQITPDKDANRKPYFVPPIMISSIDKGNGVTRIVTKQAYYERQAKQLKDN